MYNIKWCSNFPTSECTLLLWLCGNLDNTFQSDTPKIPPPPPSRRHSNHLSYSHPPLKMIGHTPGYYAPPLDEDEVTDNVAWGVTSNSSEFTTVITLILYNIIIIYHIHAKICWAKLLHFSWLLILMLNFPHEWYNNISTSILLTISTSGQGNVKVFPWKLQWDWNHEHLAQWIFLHL